MSKVKKASFGVIFFILIAIPILGIAEYPKARVTGQVVMPDKTLAANAVVEAWAYGKWDEPFEVTTTDNAGNIEMDLPYNNYWFKARTGNYGVLDYTEIKVDKQGNVKGSPYLVLQEAAIVTGRVVDKATQMPLSGVKISTEERDRTITAGDGTFQLEGILQTTHGLGVFKEGYAALYMNFDVTGRKSIELTLELKPGAIIKGRITDEKGKPIAGASINNQVYSVASIPGWSRTTTDENGEYVLNGYDPNENISDLYIAAKGYNSSSKRNLNFPSGQKEMVLNFQLTQAESAATNRKVSGKVVDKSGNPVKGALVSNHIANNYSDMKVCTTIEDGSYLLEKVAKNEELIAVQVAGYALAWQPLLPEMDTIMNFELEPGHFLEGKIVDKDGKPIADADIYPMVNFTYKQMFHRDYINEHAKTDAGGVFRFKSLPASGIKIDILKREYSDVREMDVTPDRNDLVITMLPPGQLSGTVLDSETRQPIKNFHVFVDFVKDQTGTVKSQILTSNYNDAGVWFNNTDGTFTVSGLNTDDIWEISVEAPGYIRHTLDRATVLGINEIDYKGHMFTLQKGNSIFEGFIVDTITQKGLANVKVTAMDVGNDQFFNYGWSYPQRSYHPIVTKTDKIGRFRIEGFSRVSGALVLQKEGYARTILQNVDFTKPFSTILPKGSTVQGIILDKKGNPQANVGVFLNSNVQNGNISYENISTDSTGHFQFKDLPPGNFSLGQMRGNMGYPVDHFTLMAAQDYTVDFTKKSKILIQGKLTLKGKPAKDVRVMCYAVDSPVMGSNDFTTEDGNYELNVSVPGKYVVNFQMGDQMDFSNMLFINRLKTFSEGTNRFDFAIPSATVQGLLLDQKNGKPIANISVFGYRKMKEDESPSRWTFKSEYTNANWYSESFSSTNENGEFVMKNMSAGDWIIAYGKDFLRYTPGKPFHLNQDETKEDFVFLVPEQGSAKIYPVDASTGKPVTVTFMHCVNELGFSISPELEVQENQRIGGPYMPKPKMDSDNKLTFPDLSPGKYKVCAVSNDHLTSFGEFEITTGKQTELALKMKTGGRIGLRIIESESNPLSGTVMGSIRISRKADNSPVLTDASGTYYRTSFVMPDSGPRQQFIALEPGEYKIEIKVQCYPKDRVRPVMNKINTWTDTRMVNIEQGKDSFIDIPSSSLQ